MPFQALASQIALKTPNCNVVVVAVVVGISSTLVFFFFILCALNKIKCTSSSSAFYFFFIRWLVRLSDISLCLRVFNTIFISIVYRLLFGMFRDNVYTFWACERAREMKSERGRRKRRTIQTESGFRENACKWCYIQYLDGWCEFVYLYICRRFADGISFVSARVARQRLFFLLLLLLSSSPRLPVSRWQQAEGKSVLLLLIITNI